VPELRIYTEAMMVEAGSSSRAKRAPDIELPVMSLRFNYSGIRVRPEGEADDFDLDFDDGFSSGASAPSVVRRDHAAEAQAQCLLETFGAVELSCIDDVIPPFGSEADCCGS